MKQSRTERQRAVAKALTALLPWAPFADAQAIRDGANAPHLRALPAGIAVWLATVAHVRHQHTDYDSLMDEGYDRDAARFFVADDINRTLTTWRATRLLDPESGDNE